LQRKTKNLKINDRTIYDSEIMPSYEECMKIINPQGLDPEALSHSEKIFLEFCQYFETYPENIKNEVRKW